MATTEQYQIEGIRDAITQLGIDRRGTDLIMAQIVNAQEAARMAAMEKAALIAQLEADEKKYSHVTIIVDDGTETRIIDIPKMAQAEFNVNYYADSAFDPAVRLHYTSADARVENFVFSGKPLPLQDGTTITQIRRAKD